MARLYTVRRLKIGRTEQMDALARAAGELYSQVVVWFWRTVRHKGLWLGAKHLMRWLTSALLHAHSSDAVVQSFFAALASWRERRKVDRGPQRCHWHIEYPQRVSGHKPSVGAMASPSGVRYQPHMRCSTLLPPSGVKESQAL
jgi:putative transposase